LADGSSNATKGFIRPEGSIMNKVKSDFLFAQPSFASGAARVVDLWGQLDAYNDSESGMEADAKAIAADWIVVGDDLVAAMENFHELIEPLPTSEERPQTR
jgi:hypothetical protein